MMEVSLARKVASPERGQSALETARDLPNAAVVRRML